MVKCFMREEPEMKSIKPGRGPSAMGAMGSVVMGIFGVFWTITAVSMGAPAMFPFFGVIFIIIAIVQGIYHYQNATSKNRMSVYDITDAGEEPDPLNQYVRGANEEEQQMTRVSQNSTKYNFCPYSGNKISGSTYNYCPKCGADIKKNE